MDQRFWTAGWTSVMVLLSGPPSITAPPSVCVPDVLGVLAVWINQKKKKAYADPPLESRRWTHLLYFIYSYGILSRVWKLATSLLVLRYYEHLFLFCMLKLHVTLSRFCLYLLNIYHFTYTFSHSHTEAHTHKHTCTISTQEEWRQPGTGAWLPVRGAEERLCWRPCTHKKKAGKRSGKPDIHESKEKIWAHRASSKATRLFLTK